MARINTKGKKLNKNSSQRKENTKTHKGKTKDLVTDYTKKEKDFCVIAVESFKLVVISGKKGLRVLNL